MKLTFDKAPILFEDTISLLLNQYDGEQKAVRRRYLVANDLAVDVFQVTGMRGSYLIEDVLLSEYNGDTLAVSGKSVIFGGSANVKHYLNTFFKITKTSKEWVEDKREKLRSSM